MRIFSLLMLIPPLAGIAQPIPSNIFITSNTADQLIRGNYDPNSYLPSTIITDPDEIVCFIEREASSDSLFSFLKSLSGFHNRHTYSDTVSADTGIGAARRWIHSKFQQFSQRNENRLVPSYMQFDIDATGLCGAGRFRNIFAVLPGRDTSDPAFILIEAHVDSRCDERCDIDCIAHGADDNGSGSAMVIELARVMSELSFDHTIVFMTTIGEEQGLYGAEAFARYCDDNAIEIKAVQNSDIIGGIICGNTASPPGCSEFLAIDSTQLRIFSQGTNLSDHKGFARFVKMTYEENLLPIVSVPMAISVMAPEDRTGRGGDHIPFRQHGYTAIRFTSANEYGNGAPDSTYLDHQHTSEDIIGYDTNGDQIIDSFLVDFNYLRRNSVINGVSAAMAAIGPDKVSFAIDQSGGNVTINITDPKQYDHYRIALRGSTGHDFTAVYSVESATSFVLPNIQSGVVLRVSVASVDSLGVMGLFAKEQSQSATTSSSNLSADTVHFRGVNCWPNGIDRLVTPNESGFRIRVAPNPVDEETYLILDDVQSIGSDNLSLIVTDVLGRSVASWTASGISLARTPLRISTRDWPAGLYTASAFVRGEILSSIKLTVVHKPY